MAAFLLFVMAILPGLVWFGHPCPDGCNGQDEHGGLGYILAFIYYGPLTILLAGISAWLLVWWRRVREPTSEQ
jgi:hypothetical protein